MRWTTGDRLYAISNKKCLGAQGKSVGSEVSLYDCDDNSDLQKWECRNETLLALKSQNLFIEIKPDESIALSKTTGPNNQLTITGTSSGACSRTYRELYTIEGNAFGKICMFPFMYKDRWFGDCTTYDSSVRRLWCAVETKFEHEQWGYCPTSSTEHWPKNLITGAYYQLNTQSVLTWSQADASCKQQAASLVSIIDPNEQAYISGKVPPGRLKLWIGLVLDPEHGWQWSDAKPFRYLRWNTGNPLPNPGHNCAFLDSAGEHTWQSSSCVKKLGYICYKGGAPPTPPQIEQGFCSSPWIPYNGHCFHLHRTTQTWSNAQRECRKEGGDLVTVRNVEDQSFMVSQLGYASNDELWIGLNDIRTEGLFDWSDHSIVSFTSWEYGNPAVSTDADDCVLIRGENGNWADRSCDENHGFICMKQSATERPTDEVELDLGCKAGWKRHGSFCYLVGVETKTFDAAKEDCKASGSYLADVSNRVDNAFLVSLVGLRPEKYFWLGLSNQQNSDEFVWTNTDSVRFTHWNTGMPGSQQGCVAMTTGILAGLWDLLPCTNNEKYICKHMAEGAAPTVPLPTQTPPKCADGWLRVGSRNFCSKFFTGPRAYEKTWYEARDYCRAIGGDLLSIHKIYQSYNSVYCRHGKAWIGLHIPDPSTGYTWSDGSPVNFLHWQEGEPNNHNNDESCAEFRIYSWHDSGSWNDMNCESYNDWLCQIRTGTIGTYNTTADGWLQWRGKQYYINRHPMPMEEARHFCQQGHGDLVSISSKDENVFLWKQISRSYGSYYLGLSVDLDGSSWWMDGSPIGLQRWDENQPNSNKMFFIIFLLLTGFWRTSNCGQEHQFICKRGGSPPVNATVAPTVPPKGGCSLPWTKFDSKVRNYLATTDLWIGLNSLKQDGFYWTDGKPRRYTNWGYSVSKHLKYYTNCKVKQINYTNIRPQQEKPTDIYVKLGNDSIKLVTKNLTWEDAQKHCEGDKANLASLRNEWTQAYIELLTMNLKAPVWIGLNKQKTGGYFRYIDGWQMSFVSWALGEPSKDQPCVYMDVDGQWRTAFCNRTMNSVCIQTTGMIIHSRENCNVEIFQDSHRSFWIGLYKTHRGTWQWLDRTVLDYTNWDTDVPEYDYGEIGTLDGMWRSGRGWHDRAYICKTPKGSLNKWSSNEHAHVAFVLMITLVSTLMVIAFFVYKRSPRPLPTFDNPLYFDSERSQPDVVDTNKLIENAEVENPEPILTI
uniref:Mannose receptor, C type 1b n=1 Tax=Dicentrarchus labrax TaxID=13489 RepID=A0A8C4NYA1_DICLA